MSMPLSFSTAVFSVLKFQIGPSQAPDCASEIHVYKFYILLPPALQTLASFTRDRRVYLNLCIRAKRDCRKTAGTHQLDSS